MSATQYLQAFAELYDVFFLQKPYQQEAAFVDRLIQRHSNGTRARLLDVACGTGTHAIEFEKAGYEVTAVDISTDMLAQARMKAARSGSKIEFLEQDMRTLDVPGAPFDAVTILFDSIGFAVTNQGVLEALGGVHSHLRSGGLLIFEFWHSSAMLRNYEQCRVKRWKHAGKRTIRVSESTLDVARQTCRVDYTVIQINSLGETTVYEEQQLNRYFSVPEFDQLLRHSGFESLAWHAGYQDVTDLDDDVWHIVAVARKTA